MPMSKIQLFNKQLATTFGKKKKKRRAMRTERLFAKDFSQNH